MEQSQIRSRSEKDFSLPMHHILRWMARLDWVNGLKWRQLWEYSCCSSSSSSGKSVPVGIFVCCRIYTTLWRKRCWSISSRPSGALAGLVRPKFSCCTIKKRLVLVVGRSLNKVALILLSSNEDSSSSNRPQQMLFHLFFLSAHKNGKQQHVDLSLSLIWIYD